MAYTLESLKQVIDQVLSFGIIDQKPQLDSLLEKVTTLIDSLEKSFPTSTKRTESLEIQIRDAANKAENKIDSHIADQLLGVDLTESAISIFSRNLQDLIHEFESIMQQLVKISGEPQIQNLEKNESALAAVTLKSDPSKSSAMVGYDEDIRQLKERLTGQNNVEIIPIVGMGGIGKTTLARKLYDDPHIADRFDIRAWVTISQEYEVGEVLLGLLACMRNLDDEMRQKKDYQLGDDLYKSLMGRRYLIVLDDVWSTKAWDDVKKKYLPNDANGSRIIITTRESAVADYADSCLHHQMHLLSEKESWDLLCDKVFGQGHCPLEFENIGKNIARSCAGLPLAISVMAGILRTSKSTVDAWQDIERNIISKADTSDEHFSKILSLSYNYLPHHLKPCFLYMGTFPEDNEIIASKVIRLWAAEGFVRSIEGRTLEEAAEEYLKALVDRNLILACQKETSGKAKTYKIHDILRNLCIRKASEEKFVIVVGRRFYVSGSSEGNANMVRLSVHSSFDGRYTSGMVPFIRSFVCFSSASHELLSSVLNLKLLRVLDIFKISLFKLPEAIMKLVNLRYLAFKCRWGLSSWISRLWNLRTLIFCQNYTNSRQDFTAGKGNIPLEILSMMQLRHLKFKETSVWIEQEFGDDFVQRNLHTLSTVRLLGSRSRKLLERFPNLKKLGIICDAIKVDFAFLHKLETLKCSSEMKTGARVCRSNFTFPSSLKKLTLSGFVLTKKIMATIGSLPNLEVLKLRYCEFQSPKELEWEQSEEEMFCKLEYLLLESLDIVKWCEDCAYFPELRSLVIRNCNNLEGIPSGIGDIKTLELMEVVGSSPEAVASARKIQKEQRDLGNDGLQVHMKGASR